MPKKQIEETINEAGRSTYSDEESVLTAEVTRETHALQEIELPGFTSKVIGNLG